MEGRKSTNANSASKSSLSANDAEMMAFAVSSKWKIRGRTIGRTQEWKKAMVVLQEGQSIDVL